MPVNVQLQNKPRPAVTLTPTAISLGDQYNFLSQGWTQQPENATVDFKTYLVYQLPGKAYQKVGYVSWGYQLSFGPNGGNVTIGPGQAPKWVLGG
jgi:hypothetical protein